MPNDNFNLQEFNSTLVDVRKAYRLLFDYQARVRDLISYIKDVYNLDYQGGYPKFSARSNDGANSLGRWAWDWLNLYYYEFHFQEKIIDSKSSHLSIFHLADSGFFDAVYKEEKNIEPLDVSEFSDVESSRTRLIFVAGNKWIGDGFKINKNNWKNKFFLTENLQDYTVEEKDDEKFVFKHYELSSFKDENTTLETLRDFKEFADIHGISFEIKERSLR